MPVGANTKGVAMRTPNTETDRSASLTPVKQRGTKACWPKSSEFRLSATSSSAAPSM